ncbi:ATP-dependent helicase, partial [Bacteroidota bacterium]
SDNENGEKVKIIKTLTDHEEGFIVSNSIFENHQNKQLSYKNFAILYRTNAQSRIFEESLRKQNIPYRVYGSISFYQRKEIKDMISYFRLCVNPNDEEALLRIINYPARGIGKTTIDKIRKCAQENNKNLWGIITGLDKLDAGLNKGTVDKLKGFSLLLNDFSSKIETKDASSLALYIAEKTNILKDLLSDSSPENFSKSENISELLNGIREFTDNHETEDKFIGLDRYIENVSLLTSMDEKNNNEIDKVSIMTIHSAKGLEFDHVYIVGLEEDLFPSQLSSSSQKELEEERRLFYVAITRAKKLAVITYTQSRYKWGKPINCIPSRFIREIDESFIDNTDNNNNIFREPVKKSFFQNKKFSNKDSKTSIKTRSNITDYQEKEIIKRKLKTVNSVLNKPGKTISLSEKDQNFSFSDPEKIKTGTEVEHQRFGIGKVIKMEGNSPNIKATVLFKTGGQKLLLLKFAKLKIINA